MDLSDIRRCFITKNGGYIIFENIGGKIKGFAQAWCWILLIGSVVAWIILLSDWGGWLPWIVLLSGLAIVPSASESERVCEVTNYALERGVHVWYDPECCNWWLMTPGTFDLSIANVVSSINEGGTHVNCDSYGVRPAMWIDLSALD
jgi:hypothetical protein